MAAPKKRGPGLAKFQLPPVASSITLFPAAHTPELSCPTSPIPLDQIETLKVISLNHLASTNPNTSNAVSLMKSGLAHGQQQTVAINR